MKLIKKRTVFFIFGTTFFALLFGIGLGLLVALTVNTKNMGVNIDKNEYYEIILSNSARPDEFKKK